MKSEVKVPFLNLKNQIQQLPNIHNQLKSLIESCAFVGGPIVEEFERILLNSYTVIFVLEWVTEPMH